MTALGDFSPGDVLTAADLNAIGDRLSWSPTWSGTTGGTPNITTNRASYMIVNDVALAFVNAYLASLGSATGTLRLSLPSGVNAVTSNRLVGTGAEVLTTFDTINVRGSSTTEADITYYTGASVLATSRVFSFMMSWEIS
jgi:hypothetical protein